MHVVPKFLAEVTEHAFGKPGMSFVEEYAYTGAEQEQSEIVR